MSDVFSVEKRSAIMSRVKSVNTAPEIAVRKIIHALGYRFRLHDSKLPGKPDIVLPRHKKVVFVNGCFWHGHKCHLFKWPGGPRAEFWREKILGNVARDKRNTEAYKASGWRVAVVWECALKGKYKLGKEQVINRLSEWICGSEQYLEISGCGTNQGV